MLLNLQKIRDDITSAAGDRVGMTKEQALQLLDAAETGQRATAALVHTRALVLAGTAIGLTA
jgi:hypothetical protein